MDVVRWHVCTQLVTPEQKASELLFPVGEGGFRSESFLKKAFETTAQLTGLNKPFTPRGIRRTFNDLSRVANVERSSPSRSRVTSKWGGKWEGRASEWGGSSERVGKVRTADGTAAARRQ